jgi:sugar (pentulose or hexulose) kinase
MHILAIDLGTTTLKGAVLDLSEAKVKQIIREPMPDKCSHRETLLYELDPVTVVASVQCLIAKLRKLQSNAKALLMCSQMHGMILLDTNRNPITPIITWQDQRARLAHSDSDRNCLEWAEQRLSAEQRQHLGNEVRPGIPNVTLTWFEPSAIKGAQVVSLPDYVLSQLSRSEPVIETSLAAAFGLLDLRNYSWHRDVIEALDLQNLQFPELVRWDKPAYNMDGLPCFPPIGDHQAALLGSTLQPNELSINIATGSQVSMLHPHFESGPFHTRPYFDENFLITQPDVPAGRSLDTLLGLVTELGSAGDPWQKIRQAVDATSESDLDIDLAFFQSEQRTSGHIAGIREDNLTVGRLFHAAFQSMSEAYYQQTQQFPGTVERLVFSGGIAQKQPVLRDLIAKRFGLPYRVCKHPDDTLLGLMALSKCLFE